MNIQDLPDMDDEFVGYAILMLMMFFLYVWITSPASPINFPNRATYSAFIGHFSVLLVVIIPFALLAAVESMFGSNTPKTKTASAIQNLTIRVRTYRESRKPYKASNKPIRKLSVNPSEKELAKD